MVGADGASSAVRKATGADFEGITYPERFLVVSTQEDLASVLPGIAAVNYVFDPDEWLVLLRTPEHWRILFPTDPDSPDEAETDPVRVQERLRGVADLGRDWDLLHASLYRVHQRVADRFRTGRVVLVGRRRPRQQPARRHGHEQRSARRGARRVRRSPTSSVASRRSTQLDEVLEARRDVARSYVKAVTHDNWKRLRESDEAARARSSRRPARAGRRPGGRPRLPAADLDDRLPARAHGVTSSIEPMIERRNPARTDELVGSVEVDGPDAVADAVARAGRAQADWAAAPVADRARRPAGRRPNDSSRIWTRSPS